MSLAFTVSLFDHEKDNQPKPTLWTVGQLRDRLSDFRICACTLKTCGRGEFLAPQKGCVHKYGRAWSPTKYLAGTTRSKRTVESLSLLVLDFDHQDKTSAEVILASLEPYRYWMHASHSHGKFSAEGIREWAFRVVLPLSAPVKGSDWPQFWANAVKYLGVADTVDSAAKDPSRLYFLPSCRSDDEEPMSDDHDGQILDTGVILSRSPATEDRKPTSAISIPHTDPGDIISSEIAAAKADVMTMGPAQSGVAESRNDKTFQVAARLVRDWALPESTAWEILQTWNQTCLPPESEDRLYAILRNAIAYGSESLGTRLADYRELQDSVAVVREFERLAGKQANPGTNRNENTTADLTTDLLDPYEQALVKSRRDLAIALGQRTNADVGASRLFAPASAILTRESPPTPWLVRGLIVEGGVAAVIGEPKSTKSWLALDLSIAVACGSSALGEFQVPQPRTVAYFFAEDLQSAIKSRILAFARGRKLEDYSPLEKNLWIQPRGVSIDMSKDDDVARVIASCRMIGDVGLLVLDPLRDVHTGTENDSDSMAAVFKRLRLVSSILDCTVLVVHHSKKEDPKNPAQNGNEIRGSSVINGALDSRLIMHGMGGDRRSIFECTLDSTIKAGQSAGKKRISLLIQDDPRTLQATNAVWKIANVGEDEAGRLNQEVAHNAYVLLDKLLIHKIRGGKACNAHDAQTISKIPYKEFQPARSLAINQGWLTYNHARLELTPEGERIARKNATFDPDQEGK